MNVEQIIKYKCGKCGKEYSSLERAEECCSNDIKSKIKKEYDNIPKPEQIKNINDYATAIYAIDKLEDLYWKNVKYSADSSYLINSTQKDLTSMCEYFVVNFIDDLCENKNDVFSILNTEITVHEITYRVNVAYDILRMYFGDEFASKYSILIHRKY